MLKINRQSKWLKSLSAMVCGAAMLASTSQVNAVITDGNVDIYYQNPYAGKLISSFDWAANGDLYWMEGDAYWAQDMKVHQYAAGNLSLIHSAQSFAGGWVLSYGDNIYFDDGSEYALYKYNTATSELQQVLQQQNAWGYTIHDGGLFISGADQNWSARLFYVELDANGDLTGPVIDLGAMGSPSGPIAFDSEGNLFYASGYSSGLIYKFPQVEVDAAINGTPLSQPENRVFIDFNAFGYDGATGMDFDSQGNLLVTLTSFVSPSSLVKFYLDENGNSGLSEVAAVSDGRMMTVRNYQGDIYFNDSDGIYRLISDLDPEDPIEEPLPFEGIYRGSSVSERIQL